MVGFLVEAMRCSSVRPGQLAGSEFLSFIFANRSSGERTNQVYCVACLLPSPSRTAAEPAPARARQGTNTPNIAHLHTTNHLAHARFRRSNSPEVQTVLGLPPRHWRKPPRYAVLLKENNSMNYHREAVQQNLANACSVSVRALTDARTLKNLCMSCD